MEEYTTNVGTSREEYELNNLDNAVNTPLPDEDETSFITDDQFIDDDSVLRPLNNSVDELTQRFQRLGRLPSPSIIAREVNIGNKVEKLKSLFTGSKWNYTDEGLLQLAHNTRIDQGKVFVKDPYTDKEVQINQKKNHNKLYAKNSLRVNAPGDNFVEWFEDTLMNRETLITQERTTNIPLEPSIRQVQHVSTQTLDVVTKVMENGKIKTFLDASLNELKDTGLFSDNAIREIMAAHGAVDELAQKKHGRNEKVMQMEKEIEKLREEKRKISDENEILKLEKEIDEAESNLIFQRNRSILLNSEIESQKDRIKRLIREAITKPDSNVSLRDRIKLLFKVEGLTIVSLATAIVMVFTSIGYALSPKSPSPPSGNTPSPPSPDNVPDRVKKGLEKLAQYLKEIAKKSASALPGIIGAIVSFILKSAGNVMMFLAEHVILFLMAVVSFIIYGLIDLIKK